MKILMISGFLGAGKTTFIKTLAQRTRRDFVVLENEYGGGNIDSRDLASSNSGINIWELTEGCVCCTMKEDFATSVLTIANSLDPEYLIVEPTGVAKLSSLIANLRRIQYENIVLLKPLTILDYHHFETGRRDYGEIWLDQLQNAGTVVVSKTESAEVTALRALDDKLRALNPEAQLVTRHYSSLPDEWFLSLLDWYLDEGCRPSETTEECEPPDSLTLQGVALDTPEQLILFLNGVTAGTFGEIVRAKGVLRAGTIWLRFDVVGSLYAITGAEPEERSQTVFIGRKLRRDWLRQVMQPLFPTYRPSRTAVDPKLKKRLERQASSTI